MKPSELIKPVLTGLAAGVAIVVTWSLLSPAIEGASFEEATFEGASFTSEGDMLECSQAECMRIITGGDMSFPTKNAAEIQPLIQKYQTDHPDAIHAINISDRMLNAMLTESILRDAAALNRGIRIYYGKRTTNEVVGILFPLSSDFESTSPMDGEYITLDLEYRVSGPCPPHCYDE